MSAEMILLKESYEKYRKENAGKKLQELVVARDEKTGENHLVVEYREERA